jgi:hypothetical protein
VATAAGTSASPTDGDEESSGDDQGGKRKAEEAETEAAECELSLQMPMLGSVAAGATIPLSYGAGEAALVW